ncbi:MAG: prepilin-type N-terminal cleavage/methylation domain-containing protein [Terriglobales bacterium]
MGPSMIGRSTNARAPKPAESGFSLIEVMISMVILTVGLVTLLGVFGLAMATTQTSQQNMIAKQLADEALESIMTARNTSQLGWDSIQNVGATNCPNTPPPATTCGIFLTGAQPIYFAGADGIFGTADDAAAGVETLQDPGPDGIYNTTDDTRIPLTGYQRTILISPLYDANHVVIQTLRSVTVTIQYTNGQQSQPVTYIVNSYIAQYL